MALLAFWIDELAYYSEKNVENLFSPQKNDISKVKVFKKHFKMIFKQASEEFVG
jgi:hypothetical protein